MNHVSNGFIRSTSAIIIKWLYISEMGAYVAIDTGISDATTSPTVYLLENVMIIAFPSPHLIWRVYELLQKYDLDHVHTCKPFQPQPYLTAGKICTNYKLFLCSFPRMAWEPLSPALQQLKSSAAGYLDHADDRHGRLPITTTIKMATSIQILYMLSTRLSQRRSSEKLQIWQPQVPN
jgi:hypothetical protein